MIGLLYSMYHSWGTCPAAAGYLRGLAYLLSSFYCHDYDWRIAARHCLCFKLLADLCSRRLLWIAPRRSHFDYRWCLLAHSIDTRVAVAESAISSWWNLPGRRRMLNRHPYHSKSVCQPTSKFIPLSTKQCSWASFLSWLRMSAGYLRVFCRLTPYQRSLVAYRSYSWSQERRTPSQYTRLTCDCLSLSPWQCTWPVAATAVLPSPGFPHRNAHRPRCCTWRHYCVDRHENSFSHRSGHRSNPKRQ